MERPDRAAPCADPTAGGDINMFNWLTQIILFPSGLITELFLPRSSINFIVVEIGVAIILIAALVALMVYWRYIVEFLRGRH